MCIISQIDIVSFTVKCDSDEGNAADLQQAGLSRELQTSLIGQPLNKHPYRDILSISSLCLMHTGAQTHTQLTVERRESREADTVGFLISSFKFLNQTAVNCTFRRQNLTTHSHTHRQKNKHINMITDRMGRKNILQKISDP